MNEMGSSKSANIYIFLIFNYLRQRFKNVVYDVIGNGLILGNGAKPFPVITTVLHCCNRAYQKPLPLAFQQQRFSVSVAVSYEKPLPKE